MWNPLRIPGREKFVRLCYRNVVMQRSLVKEQRQLPSWPRQPRGRKTGRPMSAGSRCPLEPFSLEVTASRSLNFKLSVTPMWSQITPYPRVGKKLALQQKQMHCKWFDNVPLWVLISVRPQGLDMADCPLVVVVEHVLLSWLPINW